MRGEEREKKIKKERNEKQQNSEEQRVDEKGYTTRPN